jgi:hypothetical protein
VQFKVSVESQQNIQGRFDSEGRVDPKSYDCDFNLSLKDLAYRPEEGVLPKTNGKAVVKIGQGLSRIAACRTRLFGTRDLRNGIGEHDLMGNKAIIPYYNPVVGRNDGAYQAAVIADLDFPFEAKIEERSVVQSRVVANPDTHGFSAFVMPEGKSAVEPASVPDQDIVRDRLGEPVML